MPFDIEMDEFHDEHDEGEYLVFHKKNFVSCSNVSIWTVLWEYFCWFLAGKPDHIDWSKK